MVIAAYVDMRAYCRFHHSRSTPAYGLLIGVALLAACATRDRVAAVAAPTPAARSVSAAPTAGGGSAAPARGTGVADAIEVDQSLLKLGHHIRQRDGEALYCRGQTVTGTHFSSSVCFTHAEANAREQDTQNVKDQLNRAGQASCATRGGCNN